MGGAGFEWGWERGGADAGDADGGGAVWRYVGAAEFVPKRGGFFATGDRAGKQGVIVLSAALPMIAEGSLLIKIDSPRYMCWAAVVFSSWREFENGGGKKWMYVAGLCAAAGMLFKPVLIALPVCVLIAARYDRPGRA